MEFTPIETQEAFDAMVKDRVERAKKSTAKEFEARLQDLEQTKEALAAKDTEIGTLKAKITDLEGASKTNEESYQSMQKELSEAKLAALKQRVAIETGIPLEMAERLAGDDEESVRKDAEAVKGFMGAKHVAPSFNNQSVPADPKKEGYRAMAQMFRKED